MTFDGDVRITNSEDGGEVIFDRGQPEMDEGLETAVYLSLFSSPGWWGNAILEKAQQLGSNLESIQSRTLSNQTRLDAEEYARQALAWMVSERVAASVSVAATIPRADMLGIVITIEQPSGTVLTLRYQINWAAQRVRAGV